jgi:hypothetical protein
VGARNSAGSSAARRPWPARPRPVCRSSAGRAGVSHPWRSPARSRAHAPPAGRTPASSSRWWPPSPPGSPPGSAAGQPGKAVAASSWRRSPPPAAAAPAGPHPGPAHSTPAPPCRYSSAATRAMICSSSCVFASISPASLSTGPKAAAARGSHGHSWRKLILVLAATLKGPRLAPSTPLINDLEDHG